MSNFERIQVLKNQEAEPYANFVAEYGSPLLILDCNKVAEQFNALSDALPNIEFFYAIKALPHPAMIRTLLQFNVGFDIASKGEIDLLRLERAQARNTIHTHPIKRDDDIRDALSYGCTTFVVDNIWELEKFVAYRHRVALLIRVSFPNAKTNIDLSRKFGCQPSDVLLLLRKAKALGIHVKGLSFHAGSQCTDSSNHVHAIRQCAAIIEQAEAELGKLLPILDIGGGFPVSYTHSTQDINQFCYPINEALATLPAHINVIAEPGRFLSAPAMESVSRVIGKAERSDGTWYYLDDGVYNSYSGQVYDHATYPLTVFSDGECSSIATLAGPTCDSIDVIAEQVNLPPLRLGDLVIGKQMGAYTSASSTRFNSLETAEIVVINGPSVGLNTIFITHSS